MHPDQLTRIRLSLGILDAADSIEGVDVFPLRLHPLKGELQGRWAVTVRANCGSYSASKTAMSGTSIWWTITEEDRMAMKHPPHPGELVREALQELDLSVAAAAEGLGVTRQQLYRVIKGSSAISPEMALRLEKAFGGTADTWLRMQIAFDIALIRDRETEIEVKRLAPM